MDDAILVLNSGSSSIKFSVFLELADQVEFKFGGLVEGLYTSPRFIAKDRTGTEIGTHTWGDRVRLGHEGALVYLIEFLSGSTTLVPGTVILTGTPSGVGMARTPPRWLKPGDSVTVEIERIGQLTNPVVAET